MRNWEGKTKERELGSEAYGRYSSFIIICDSQETPLQLQQTTQDRTPSSLSRCSRTLYLKTALHSDLYPLLVQIPTALEVQS
jgi:hypothetical protein